MKNFIIQDVFGDRENITYLNESTTDLENLWFSLWPKNKDKSKDFRPKVFENQREAKRYLREVKSHWMADWNENSHIHKIYGKRKPSYDIYEISI